MQVARKLAAVQLVGPATVTVCAAAVSPAGQPQALRVAVSALAPLLAGRGLVLDGFTMSAGLAAALPAAAAACSELSLQTLTWSEATPPITTTIPPLHTVSLDQPLTNTLLSQLQCASAIGTLCVTQCRLRTPPPASIGIPMQAIRVGSASVRAWLRQVSMLGDRVAWEIDGSVFILDAVGDAQVLASFMARLFVNLYSQQNARLLYPMCSCLYPSSCVWVCMCVRVRSAVRMCTPSAQPPRAHRHGQAASRRPTNQHI